MSGRSVNPQGIKARFQKLRGNKAERLILDGGTGEELFVQGVPNDRKIWSAAAIVKPEYHETLKKVHRSFIEAGAEAITANSYGVVPGVGFSASEIKQYVATAAKIAREAAQDSKTECNTLVFGSLGPLVESYRPDLIMPHEQGVEFYRSMAQAMSPFVDCFLAETMSSTEECMQAIDAVGCLSGICSRPILVSFTLSSEGALRSGECVKYGVRRVVNFAQEQNVQMLGVLFNCAEPEAISRGLQSLHSNEELQQLLWDKGIILGAYANRLRPVPIDWSIDKSNGPQPMRGDLSPCQYYHEFISEWMEQLGVQMVGGCCGISPTHIAFLTQHLRNGS